MIVRPSRALRKRPARTRIARCDESELCGAPTVSEITPAVIPPCADAARNVRFQGQPGRHLLTLSSSQFDPKADIGQSMARERNRAGRHQAGWRIYLSLFIGAACSRKRQRTRLFGACQLESIAIQWVARTRSMA